jgi:diguanylate cyclase (GGDEF)-like protein/PAS domain S-box-containing protein
MSATDGAAPGVLPVLVSEILEALPVAVLVIDSRQRIREFNPEASRLFGHARADLLGAPLERLVPERVRDAHAGWVREFTEHPTSRAMGLQRELLARHADGRLIPVEIALNPVRAGGELFVVAAVLDISARRALEQRILADKAELERQVHERTAELERSNLEQREMLDRLEAARAQLEKLSREDALTGIANRREFDLRLALEHERSVRHGRPLALAMLDLDRFKNVNDLFGHAIGDQVLRQVAAVLCRQCRTIDLPARYGGEEFVVALPDTGLLEAQALCERIRIAIQQHDWSTIQPGLALTVSIGVAVRTPADTPQQLVEHADQAMYRAKDAGRNRVELFRD